MATTASHSGTFIQGSQKPKAKRPSGPTALRSPTPIGRPPTPFYIGRGLIPGARGPFRPGAPRPPAPAPAPTPVAPAPPPDPRDAEYLEGLTGLRGTREGVYGDLDRNEGYAVQDRDDALKALVKSRAQSLMNAKNAANARGLFYSSYLTNQNADIGSDFDDRNTAVGEQYRRNHENIESSRAAAERAYGKRGSEDDFGTEGQRLLREAIARATGAQADEPATDPAVTTPQVQGQTVDTSATSAGDTSRDGGWGPGGLTVQDIIALANRKKRPAHKVIG